MAHANPIELSRAARWGVMGVAADPGVVIALYCRRCVDTHAPNAGSGSYRLGTRQSPFSFLYASRRLNISSHFACNVPPFVPLFFFLPLPSVADVSLLRGADARGVDTASSPSSSVVDGRCSVVPSPSFARTGPGSSPASGSEGSSGDDCDDVASAVVFPVPRVLNRVLVDPIVVVEIGSSD